MLTSKQRLLPGFVALAAATRGCLSPEWPGTPISNRRTFTVVGAIHLVRPSSPACCRKRNSDPDNYFLPRLSSMARPIAPSLLPSHPILPPALITLQRISRAGNSIQTLLLTKLKLSLSAVGQFRRSSPNTLPA